MTIEPAPGGPPAAAVEKPNPFQRIVGVLIAPTKTFDSIAQRPDILWPLTIFIVLSLVLSLTLIQRMDFGALAQDAMEMNSQTSHMSPEQMQRATSFSAALMKMGSYAGPFLSAIVLAITAGILLIAFRLMAGEGDFRQAFSVTTYAWYPRLIKSALGVIVLLSKKSMTIWDMQNPLRSNPAFLFNPKTQPIQFNLATSFDVFSIWSLVLTIIGFAALSKLSKAKAAAIVIVLWIIVIVIALIPSAIQASRMHS